MPTTPDQAFEYALRVQWSTDSGDFEIVSAQDRQHAERMLETIYNPDQCGARYVDLVRRPVSAWVIV